MATNYKNTCVERITTHDTFPLSATKTGTITTNNTYDGKRVIGTSTLFTTELEIGGWLADITNDEVREITGIKSNTNLTIDHAFSNSLSGAAVKYIPPSALYVEMSIVFVSVAGKIDGKAVPPSIGICFGKSSRDQSAARDYVDPVVIDASGTAALLFGTK